MGSVGKGLPGWQSRRQLGDNKRIGEDSSVYRSLYSSLACVRSWNPKSTVNHTHHGGIFNFDFSPDGSLLVAACQGRSILMFDPYNSKVVAAKNQAHTDCVNCVRFLDSRTFATCSDDTTVCLWDARFLKTKMRTLRGHSEWVKNIEYASNKEVLVTSGFDGSIYTWDINRYSENEVSYTRAFRTNGLMRTKLTPDNSKLIIATTGGYLMVVHDLDLSTLATDLQGFKPNMYRLMQMSGSLIRQGYMYNHVFEQKTNRVQLISDFPRDDEAEMIASLEVHPQGWCVVSRNTSRDNKSEWTCVHDIQHPPRPRKGGDELVAGADKDDMSAGTSQTAAASGTSHVTQSGSVGLGAADLADENAEDPEQQRPVSPSFMLSISLDDTVNSMGARGGLGGISVGNLGNNLGGGLGADISASIAGAGLSGASVAGPSDYQEGDSSDTLDIRDQDDDRDPDDYDHDDSNDDNDDDAARMGADGNWLLVDRERSDAQYSGRRLQRHTHVQIRRATQSNLGQLLQSSNSASFEVRRREVQFMISSSLQLGESVTFIIQSGGRQQGERPLQQEGLPKPLESTHRIHQNNPTLTHYIEEPNVGQGFIKEVSFSNDGRLICSPFSYGVRLLAFQPGCQELSDCDREEPYQLYEVTSSMGHSNTVVTTKFSPVSCLLVSGCLDGKVNFYQPRL